MGINISRTWLKPLKCGMMVRTISKDDIHAGQTMEIIGIDQNASDFWEGFVVLRLQEKIKGKNSTSARFWWIYEYCELVSELESSTK